MLMPEGEDGEVVESEDMIISKRDLKASTQKILRQFAKRENRMMLMAFRGEIKTSE